MTGLDLSAIGAWAGNYGPFLGVIVLQFRIIWMLLDRFFAQQKILTDALEVNAKAIDAAAKDGEK